VTAVEVNRIAVHAAHAAFRMDDPHPGGYLWDTQAHRVGRAVWAYEWAKANMKESTVPGWFEIPDPAEVRAAVLANEAAEPKCGGLP
jgi:hypothetical protein